MCNNVCFELSFLCSHICVICMQHVIKKEIIVIKTFCFAVHAVRVTERKARLDVEMTDGVTVVCVGYGASSTM